MAFWTKLISFIKPILNINIFFIFGIALYFFYTKIEYSKLESENESLRANLGELKENMLKEQQKLYETMATKHKEDIKLIEKINKNNIKNINKTQLLKPELKQHKEVLDNATLSFIKELYGTH